MEFVEVAIDLHDQVLCPDWIEAKVIALTNAVKVLRFAISHIEGSTMYVEAVILK